MPISCAMNRTETTHCKEPVNKDGEEKNSPTPIRQNGEASRRHNSCNKQADYIVVNDEPNTTIGNN